MSEIFFYSISEAYLQRIDINLESVICYIDIEFNNKEVKTEIVENGFNAELEQDIWDTKITKETHLTSDGEFCPVGPQKAALLYPLYVLMKESQCVIRDVNFYV